MAIESPFREVEAAAGARFAVYGGLELPDRFADAMAECETVRAAAGLFDLSFRSRLAASGSDRASFLHNLLSNDVAGLMKGSGRYAAILTDQSKVISDVDVLHAGEALLLDVDARLLERVKAHLERYLVADDVELEDRRPHEATLGVHGAHAEAIVGSWLGEGLPEAPLAHRVVSRDGVPLRLVRRSWTGEAGFDLFVARADAPRVWQSLREHGEAHGLAPIGMFAFNVLRLEAGMPWPGVDFDETTLALEAALEAGISFTKGCYLGQETVERVAARGHVNRRRVGLRLDGDRAPRSGARLLRGEEEVGRITSAAFSPTLQSVIAMGYAKRGAGDLGNRLEVEDGSTRLGAVVVETPFVKRG